MISFLSIWTALTLYQPPASATRKLSDQGREPHRSMETNTQKCLERGLTTWPPRDTTLITNMLCVCMMSCDHSRLQRVRQGEKVWFSSETGLICLIWLFPSLPILLTRCEVILLYGQKGFHWVTHHIFFIHLGHLDSPPSLVVVSSSAGNRGVHSSLQWKEQEAFASILRNGVDVSCGFSLLLLPQDPKAWTIKILSALNEAPLGLTVIPAKASKFKFYLGWKGS